MVARCVALDPILLQTLELQEGDQVSADLDVGNATTLLQGVCPKDENENTEESLGAAISP